MSKGGGGGTNTVQKADPWAGQQPYLTNLYSEAQRLYDQGPMQYYPGRTIAEPSETQLLGENLMARTAMGGQSSIAGSLLPAIQNQLLGPSNVADNPYLAAAAESAIRPLYSGAQGLLQQARRGATQAGQLGGTRQAILEQGVIGDYLQKAGDMTSNMYNQAYQDALKTQAASIANVPIAMQSIMTPAQTLTSLGGLETARAQQAIEAQREAFEFGQRAPSASLNQYANVVAGSLLPGTISSQSGGGTGLGTGSMLGGAVGGAAGMGALYGQTAGQGLAAMGGPMGMAAGMLLGSLFD